MRASEFLENVNWAIGKNIDKATKLGQKEIQDPNNEIIWVDIKDLFSKTGSDQRLDVDDPTGGKNRIGDRITRAIEHWKNGGYMNPAFVGWNDYFRNIGFTDGRHRLVAAYQMGERWAPIIVDKQSIDKVRELVRTK